MLKENCQLLNEIMNKFKDSLFPAGKARGDKPGEPLRQTMKSLGLDKTGDRERYGNWVRAVVSKA